MVQLLERKGKEENFNESTLTLTVIFSPSKRSFAIWKGKNQRRYVHRRAMQYHQ